MEWWQWIVLLAIIGCVAFLVWYRKQQTAKGGGRPQQKGIIK